MSVENSGPIAELTGLYYIARWLRRHSPYRPCSTGQPLAHEETFGGSKGKEVPDTSPRHFLGK